MTRAHIESALKKRSAGTSAYCRSLLSPFICLTTVTAALLTNTATAAPVYSTSVGADGLEAITLSTGSSGSYSSLESLNITPSYGEASASGYTIHVSGKPEKLTDDGFLAQYFPVAYGSITFKDIIFSDSSSSGSGGSTTVSANFSIAANQASDLAAQVFINGSFYSIRPVSPGTYSSDGVVVPLDVPVNLRITLRLKQPGFSDGNGNRLVPFGSGSMTLLSTPFQLDSGITASSLDGSIINNQLSAVPIPAAVWLFGSGLLALLGIAKRRTT